MTIQFRIDINNLVWTVYVDRASKDYVGACDALSLVASGATWEELQKDMRNAIQDLFDYLLSEGELDKTLRGLGWSKAVPKAKPKQKFVWDVPFSVVRQPPPMGLAAHA